MRTIDGDALKIALDTFATLVGFRGVYDRGQVMECIDAAPTVGGWISVKDRLPENETEVIIIVQHKIGWYRAFAWHDEYGWHSSAEEFGDGESDFVTHWMPLPEPPVE